MTMLLLSLLNGALATESRPALEAIQLPLVANDAREAGIPEDQVRGVLEQNRDRGVPVEDTVEVLESGAEAAEEHGPVDNFGAFVQSQLDAGLRGQELAAAIHAEHAARGKGKPEDRGKPEQAGKGKPEDKGKPDQAGKGKPEDKGKPEQAGKGKSSDKGKSAGKQGGKKK